MARNLSSCVALMRRSPRPSHRAGPGHGDLRLPLATTLAAFPCAVFLIRRIVGGIRALVHPERVAGDGDALFVDHLDMVEEPRECLRLPLLRAYRADPARAREALAHHARCEPEAGGHGV